METHLADWLRGTPEGSEAESILRTCVHCGFCTATCPTYQLLGDELDGPRGRIYLIKQVLEGVAPTRETQLHLDRCLTCRNCESTCPSGVQYGHLVDIGRKLVDDRVERPLGERLMRGALREGLTRPWLFGPAMRIGQMVRPLLPASVQAKVPERRDPGAWPARVHPRKVLLLQGCVQPGMIPAIDAATARVLDAVGVQSIVAERSGCCGAIRHHLGDHAGALDDARRNIDAWWPWIEGSAVSRTDGGALAAARGTGVEAIVINASGCGAMLKDYGHLLRDDPTYAGRARRVASLTRDLAEFLPGESDRLRARLVRGPITPVAATAATGATAPTAPTAVAAATEATEATEATAAAAGASIASNAATPDGPPRRVVFHPPCTLQHGQQVRGAVEALLTACGAELQPFGESHLCCGSAGTYSVLQPGLSRQLRDRKLGSLQADAPQAILSANIGCLTHLQSGTATPVRHWIEWIDQAIGAPPS